MWIRCDAGVCVVMLQAIWRRKVQTNPLSYAYPIRPNSKLDIHDKRYERAARSSLCCWCVSVCVDSYLPIICGYRCYLSRDRDVKWKISMSKLGDAL